MVPIHIPVARPHLTGAEARHVNEALAAGQLSMGPKVAQFERVWAEHTQVPHALSTMNGTVALHLLLAAAGIGPGDEVIVPALTYVATGNAARYCGADVVLCDVDPETWTLDPRDLERKITKDTAAIIAVHLFGVPADMDAIHEVVRASGRKGVLVFEDAAQAHGTNYKGRAVGSLGDGAMFSFFGNKPITCGEGGMLVTNDDDLASAARLLRGQGMAPERRYFHPVVGFNYRMTELQAAVGLGQMETFHERMRQRERVVSRYRANLRGQKQLMLAEHDIVPWTATVLCHNRDNVTHHLRQHGVETRPFFHPLSDFPMYYDEQGYRQYPVSYSLARTGLMLPTHEQLTDEAIDEVCLLIGETS